MRVVDESVLGKSFYAFRNTYFYPSGYMGYDWRINADRLAALTARIAKKAVFLEKKDCLDLPEQLDENRIVELAPKQKRAYDDLARTLIAQFGSDVVLARNEISKLMRLRQVTSGFLIPELSSDDAGADDPDPLARARILWLDSSKYTALNELAEETAPKRMLVWVNFHAEAHECLRVLSKHGKTELFTGEVAPAERPDIIKRFRAGQTRFLVAHPRCAGHGLTLVECDLAVYVSLSYSWEDYKQSRDRLHRAGQTNKVTYVHLLAKGTIDEDILVALKNKRDVALDVLSGLKRKYK
jgi:SNF2 family DNA or RNA helicase